MDVDETILIPRGLHEVRPFDETDRIYVKLLDSSGEVVFHGLVSGMVRIEIVGKKEKPV